MNEYIKISFTNLSSQQKDMLIALLADAGYDGFEEIDNNLDAFIPQVDYDEPVLVEILRQQNLPFTKTVIEPKNWNQVWESNFHPVIVDDFVAVRAHFHEPVATVLHEIIITPKMSFGTGHHATTHMMMQQMKEIDFTGKSVFDFGTGTGILAILASKLGAASITAIDNDEWSINNAAENFQNNAVTNIQLQLSDGPLPHQRFDVILANITKNIILKNFAYLNEQLNKNAILLLSGLLEDDEDEILRESGKHSLSVGKKLREGNWLCMRFLR